MSREIEHLDPKLRILAREFIQECAADGIPVLIYYTWRSDEEQNSLYAKGRTAPGKIVTYLRGGKSKHNKTDKDGNPASQAFDAVPLRNGKPIWSDPKLWSRMGQIGDKLNLEWGGNWKKFKDSTHFQLRG